MDNFKIIGLGLVFIIAGLLMIYYASSQPKSIFFSIKAKGYIAGITFIIIGIIYMLNELHLW
jgi:uncharacterized protein YjeT (DUF2065 family)